MNDNAQWSGQRMWIIGGGLVPTAGLIAMWLATGSRCSTAREPVAAPAHEAMVPAATPVLVQEIREPAVAPNPPVAAPTAPACDRTPRFECPRDTRARVECVDHEVGLDYPYGDDSSPVVLRQTCVQSGNPRVAHGPVGEWRANGKRTVAGNLHHGERDGAWTMWFSSGMVAARVSYRRGSEHGRFVTYHFDSRQTSTRGQYRDGLPFGAWRCFSESGQVIGRSYADCPAD